jgi:hypothetical protein
VHSFERDNGAKDNRKEFVKLHCNVLHPAIFFAILVDSFVHSGKVQFAPNEQSVLNICTGTLFKTNGYVLQKVWLSHGQFCQWVHEQR